MKLKSVFVHLIVIFVLFIVFASVVFAADPVGADWFQLLTSHQTGSDNTGDGGTGNAADLNYYYVGQTFTANMQIQANTGANAANIWIDYDVANVAAAALVTGSFYPIWSGQTVAGGRIKSTGYRNSGYSVGLGDFGAVNFTMLRPTAAAYGLGAADILDINTGIIGATTESNISRDGVDVLDSVEDFMFHIWADTVKPYAANPAPIDAAVNVAVESLYEFELCDSKDGEVADAGVCLASGVGTGVDTSTPPGVITFDDGGGAADYTAFDAYSCGGVWGTNDCDTDIDPPSPLAIAGDQRNWKYDTLYTVAINSFIDRASAAQDQLGDANGPNAMNAKVWTFRTEKDTVPPEVVNEIPARGSVNNSVDTNITIDILDLKVYPGTISGVGIDPATCRVNVSSPTFAFTTYQQGGAVVTVNAIDYGYRFVIDPATDFGQNETVSVSVYDCEDWAGNKMLVDNYTFDTADTTAPYVDNENPVDDAIIAVDGVVQFDVNDDGVGVDLNTVVIMVGDQVYTNGGGAGQVTVSGTRITYAASLDFNGGNFVGDTTSVAGALDEYNFVIDLENDFAAGEAVPVLIYASDFSGNLMERVVYTLVTAGGGGGPVCPDGSTYCGADTNWDGALCVGNGGGGGGTGGGGGGGVLVIRDTCETPDPVIQTVTKYIDRPVEVPVPVEVEVPVEIQGDTEIVYRDKIVYRDNVVYVDRPVSDFSFDNLNVGNISFDEVLDNTVIAQLRQINDDFIYLYNNFVLLQIDQRDKFILFSGVSEPFAELTLLVY